jgi:hypothetical protein
MKLKSTNIIAQNQVFIWIGLATASILAMVFLAMQLHLRLPNPGGSPAQINWNLLDFVAMGTLLFGTSSLFVISARVIPKKYWAFLGIAFVLGFLYLWAELAVGIFTNWGS